MSFFSIGHQKIWGPKTTYFWWIRNSKQLRGPISPARNIGKRHWKLRRVPYTVLKFHELWSAKAKNRTVVFTHPPRSSSAWRQWPSRWPALWRANISSYSCHDRPFRKWPHQRGNAPKRWQIQLLFFFICNWQLFDLFRKKSVTTNDRYPLLTMCQT